ncbi:hypothetical protein SERLA73DRAFT_178299 [Serpula lacrymans var. lacrymans S7.3]|uniref:tRNA (guanine(9)-N1)-methyltransferase n=2 Tax=Serpula lacrymans var. lacrymans TaxID=341189 RepID=F8PR94_SERL3|nr:uncharacterized protein SERLADRAFT_462631 [Serpula lacrymans var. lacrymans S7.9]EGO02385.1 hypothetical protein SERLA73DRAFT_178299 [Serpula lacrymans var. lacrymans S7.3]EGO28112.1 hypothetical protein SERLADRAFT_462631 [Serpula lacrymans var. lacrymans S7.9]
MDSQVTSFSPPSVAEENTGGQTGDNQGDVVHLIDSADKEPEQEPLSKKARKKAAKAAYLASVKLERRAREKEAKKRKKQAERERKMAQGEVGDGKSSAEASSGPGERRRKRRKLGQGDEGEGVNVFAAKVVVDLGFDELMSEKEITSLTSQLAYTYSANRHAARPFSGLIFSSLGGRTRTRLDAMNDAGYRRWIGTEWWEEGYERLWTDGDIVKEQNSVEGDGSLETPGLPEHLPEKKTEKEVDDARESVVYLTADSVDELEELKEGETYIIGGICDHNRYKNLCLNKASESKIRHARLPIGRYIASLTTRKVLTVNQVFEILVKWVEGRDWEEAFWSVIPRRKFQNGAERDEENKGVDGGGDAEGKGDGGHEVEEALDG